MNIIFGEQQAVELAKKYTVLELDTFQLPGSNSVVTAYCTVENIPLQELTNLKDNIDLHNQFLTFYKTRNWSRAVELIDQLMGVWGGELDSFYQELQKRMSQYLIQDPGPDWSPVIVK